MAVLEKIKKPCDIRLLPSAELSALCQELRQRIIQVTSRNGGHLAANLGVVELTVALHRVFDFTPGHDVIVFDVVIRAMRTAFCQGWTTGSTRCA